MPLTPKSKFEDVIEVVKRLETEVATLRQHHEDRMSELYGTLEAHREQQNARWSAFIDLVLKHYESAYLDLDAYRGSIREFRQRYL